jgi:mannonate dehydratase
MEQTWRWFGPVIQLGHIRQAGATGEIEARKVMIKADPSLSLRWSMVESLPVHVSTITTE